MKIKSVPLRGTLLPQYVHTPDFGRCASLGLELSIRVPLRGTEHNKLIVLAGKPSWQFLQQGMCLLAGRGPCGRPQS